MIYYDIHEGGMSLDISFLITCKKITTLEAHKWKKEVVECCQLHIRIKIFISILTYHKNMPLGAFFVNIQIAYWYPHSSLHILAWFFFWETLGVGWIPQNWTSTHKKSMNMLSLRASCSYIKSYILQPCVCCINLHIC
jgi:hypothetical protein